MWNSTVQKYKIFLQLVRKQDRSQAGTEGGMEGEAEARVYDLNQIGTCTGSEEGTVHIISTQLV